VEERLDGYCVSIAGWWTKSFGTNAEKVVGRARDAVDIPAWETSCEMREVEFV